MANVTVELMDGMEDAFYEGEYDVALGPEGVLVVNEMVPDVLEGGPPKVRVRCLYNATTWKLAELGD